MRNRFIYMILVSALGMALSIPLYAVTPFTIENREYDGLLIGKHAEYLEDKDKKLDIADIIAEPTSRQFKPLNADSLGFGYTHSRIWVRFQIRNASAQSISRLLEMASPFYDVLWLYSKPERGDLALNKFNVMLSAYEREINSVNFFFTIECNPGVTTYYMKLETNGPLNVNLKIWSRRLLDASLFVFVMMASLIYGVFITMFLYNLFLFISIRERAYFYYLMVIVASTFLYLIADMIGTQYVWSLTVQLFKENIPVLVLPLVGIFHILFTRDFLGTRKQTPWIDRYLLMLVGLMVLSFMSNFIFGIVVSTSVSYLLDMVAIVSSLCIIGPRYLQKRSRPALFYFSAYIFLMTGALVRGFMDFGVLPNAVYTFWSSHIGCACMMIMFSLGLADRINTMKNQLADLNKNLERKVQERTMELQAAMEELEAMNTNLQTTMEELEATNEQLIQARDALWGEMQLAKKIQTVLLPVEPVMAGYQINAYMQTADEVGGDYYDVISEGGRDWIVIGDVSGHGVPAGLVMMMVQTAIHTALSNHSDMSPSQLLMNINRTITDNIHRLGENKYMTITVFACIADGRFHHAGLHQDIIVYRAAQRIVEQVPTTGMWIGLFDDLNGMLTDNEFCMAPGDIMLLYTDGITEARASSDEMFGEERLVGILERHAERSPEEIKEALIRELEPYNKNDDISLLIVKRS